MAREKYPYNAWMKLRNADAVGEYVHLLCVKAGQWQTVGYAGTWAHEG